MASYKNINSDYTLTCNNGNGIFTINAITRFNEDVTFNGNVTYVVPATTESAFFTAAANNTGAIRDMGLLGQTGANTFAGLRFDTLVNAWQTSASVYANGTPIQAYANIGSTPGGDDQEVQFNNNGTFGAVANLKYDITNSQLTLNGTMAFGNIFGNTGNAPANVDNAVVLYSNISEGGGTGLYFTSSSYQDELVSKRNAIIYGIIF